MNELPSVADSSARSAAKSLSPLTHWFIHDPLVPKPQRPLKPPATPPAAGFLRSAREWLGQISQNYLADCIEADRSMVGRWEMADGGAPSWPYVGRILVLLGVLDDNGKLLRSSTERAQSAAMGIEERVLAILRQLPNDKQLDVLEFVRDKMHEAAASQPPAALKKG